MENEHHIKNIENQTVEIFKETCGTWQSCDSENVVTFLNECREHSIDPQFCLNWLEEHKEQIPGWLGFSKMAQDWVSEHTSTGSPISMKDL
ncbi:hypothetical protein [Bacillus solitudinis]|uniref:hypothetical protein n=1 Tax=Bacillus solitudinis TaxID=2014074 RepID=UPI000C23043C|nr:hypothetical protein [Bacillus solitudinis]